jgi:hypothetical protein
VTGDKSNKTEEWMINLQIKISSEAKHGGKCLSPSYLGGRDLADCDSSPAQQQQKLGVVVCTCHPSYKEGINQKTAV